MFSTVCLALMCRYYHNITSNTLVVLEAMAAHGVNTLIYSSTCATYGEPEKMPITEETPQASKLGFMRSYFLNFLFEANKLKDRPLSTCFQGMYGYNARQLTFVLNQLRFQSIHMEKLRRWQKISSWISPRIQTWQL